MRQVRVALGDLSYDIVIGRHMETSITGFIQQEDFSKKALLLSDTNVGKIYGEKFMGLLQEAGFEVDLYLVKAGETSKSLTEAEKIYTRAIELGLDRKSPVFALGGGVVGDLAGFIAATYMRGVPFIQIPTSLLAQVDSSVGGKVAVNHPLGKNLIGAFYQPQAVFIDLALLDTLPAREIYTGLGEIIKYGVIYDKKFFSFLEDNIPSILALAAGPVEHMVARSCEIKAAVVGADEREAGLRRILNFGHTIAHAIEKETRYARYNHGEAVAIGMVGAARISRAMGFIDESVLARLIKLIADMHLPTCAEGCTVESMFAAIFHDKKTVNGRVNWILMQEIGRVFVTNEVSDATVQEAMVSCIDA
jgi:3-dehydroquinate synthase